MRKWSWILGLLFLSVAVAYGAWDPTHPTDDELKKDVPGWVRANWDAIATGTDAALQITNAKVAASAGIVDTKLATISTAGKVNGAAITGLASVPSGAGALPVANGGTAATSASAARTSLGAAASGANSDITSLTGITTALGIAYGGTGSTSQNFVDLTAGQTVAGVKTFSSFPVTPSSAPTTNYQVANKKYVDDKVITSHQFFTSSGTFTAPTGVSLVFITAVAGGGGGGQHDGMNGSGGGGGGAHCIKKPYVVTAGNGYTVTINSGGTGGIGSGGAQGIDGGSVVFDTLTFAGGTHGSQGGSGVGGGVGLDAVTTTAGSYILKGGNAGSGSGSAGGGSLWGIGGAGVDSGQNGNNATGYGAGGSGSWTSHNSGSGTNGAVLVEW